MDRKDYDSQMRNFLLGIAAVLAVLIVILSGILIMRLVQDGKDSGDHTASVSENEDKNAAAYTKSSEPTTEATTAATTASTTEAPKLSVENKTWSMNSHHKEFTVKNKNKDSSLNFRIEDTDVVAGVTHDPVKKGKFKIGVFARKSGTTKIHIYDSETNEELTVKVKVNIKDNKYLTVSNTRITVKKGKSKKIHICDNREEEFTIYYYCVADQVKAEWSPWEDNGVECDLKVFHLDNIVGNKTFLVIKDEDTKDSEFIDVYYE